MTIQQGFAIRRNGSCLAADIERDCGLKTFPFRACCPIAYECQNIYNSDCCPTGRNCTEELLAAPKQVCANSSWDLLDNGGYFCCESGSTGFNSNGKNLCASPGAFLPASVQLLRPIVTGATDSSSGNASASPTPTATIAGSIAGGIAGLMITGIAIWVILRWRQRQKARKTKEHEDPDICTKAQLDDTSRVHEAADDAKFSRAQVEELPALFPPVELPASSAPTELAAEHQDRMER
ncbi:hypothetical protein BU25DRAFT_458457 [Macroventuria anomochaeta]|uniref:Uncharacterized protein n=1 Tax=Macroventuria anomochaeta TaxID=301207 RepID=A0ACB6RZV0_9PLEO|nr:uncharacterized protein BU25DRAFT_458457 [Macroventuria anomochaeta]KAF2627560.1 hypothetical protein BU25DRAFT_458457 [Macroventuria anomochaeta]